MASAPHGAEEAPYPASLRPAELDPGWFERLRGGGRPDAAIRFRVDDRPVSFVDRVQGPITERVDLAVGDFVLKRRDGLWAYQLAVVVDDLAMEIDDVVRGADLLASTARQIQLIEALGGTPPAYAHVPLMVNARGEKLSKRDQGLTLRSLREAGVEPRGGRPATSPTPSACSTAPSPAGRPISSPVFAWEKIGRADWVLPEDLAGLWGIRSR